ncbi:xanthine dehydrogenase accessory protein XdhC [Chimaeribacter arupi]|uniref:Xanthine dehydrogenase accessory protein XdhC n=2 Tax=Yersiniaceae TaxID=1903411 RepID=A0A2N5ESI5_9GAMM|nr:MULTISPECIES: xanthine dehydrogenase accessory protein XdhC [Yersiniaceae]MBS0971378.1 xanthine dehydrogenase accessory protein XdhC [Nissabacter archeti]PLR45341.1 xanthine dehydrogenase accessory protein XdhC [Chimaeribacter arupi]PLR46016.1 xanthine dehydrogenase accessory protein XdhC [Chimaeribacter arupi]PLR53046.1 xanthine dehydrogenase accessory protein XdhC [Chimaeribacter arupi]WKZ90710.1 xanthine dehydrogenase accessory protein XdhC [Chimaeribacter arupi]
MRHDEWLTTLNDLQQRGESCVLVTVVEHHGSTPRDSGSKMVVTADRCYHTIGGGNLEFQALAQARTLLHSAAPATRLERFPLAARLGQCCGGSATLLFEPLVQRQPLIAVFGAGHVGRALVTLLATLPCRIHWVDSRAAEFPAVLPPGVVQQVAEEPEEVVATLPPGSYFVVLTHDHPLDLALSEQILRRDDFRYFGLIGSATKRKRFDYRLSGKGISDAGLQRMRCPIGLPDVTGKLPAEIAVAIAGEIIACYQADRKNLA